MFWCYRETVAAKQEQHNGSSSFTHSSVVAILTVIIFPSFAFLKTPSRLAWARWATVWFQYPNWMEATSACAAPPGFSSNQRPSLWIRPHLPWDVTPHPRPPWVWRLMEQLSLSFLFSSSLWKNESTQTGVLWHTVKCVCVCIFLFNAQILGSSLVFL